MLSVPFRYRNFHLDMHSLSHISVLLGTVDKCNLMINESTTDCPALPKGWRRRAVVAPSGNNSARLEVSYINPTGQVFTTRSQLERYLHGIWDLSQFDFESGKMLGTSSSGVAIARRPPLHNSNTRPHPYKIGGVHHGHQLSNLHLRGGTNHPTANGLNSRNFNISALTGRSVTEHRPQLPVVKPGVPPQRPAPPMNVTAPLPATTSKHAPDPSLVPPIRQTASIFKQPVTLVHTTSRESRSAPPNELKQIAGSKAYKPKQVFWAKRLENVTAYSPTSATESEQEIVALPSRLTAVGPSTSPVVAQATLAKTLQMPIPGQPVTGQTGPKKSLETNPGVFVNPDQPLVQAAVIMEEEVSTQERRVQDARRRLEEALRHFS